MRISVGSVFVYVPKSPVHARANQPVAEVASWPSSNLPNGTSAICAGRDGHGRAGHSMAGPPCAARPARSPTYSRSRWRSRWLSQPGRSRRSRSTPRRSVPRVRVGRSRQRPGAMPSPRCSASSASRIVRPASDPMDGSSRSATMPGSCWLKWDQRPWRTAPCTAGRRQTSPHVVAHRADRCWRLRPASRFAAQGRRTHDPW